MMGSLGSVEEECTSEKQDDDEVNAQCSHSPREKKRRSNCNANGFAIHISFFFSFRQKGIMMKTYVCSSLVFLQLLPRKKI